MGFQDAVRQIVDGTTGREDSLWQRFIGHDQAYQSTLEVSDKDVAVMERSQPHAGLFPEASDLVRCAWLKVQLEGETFAVLAKNVCGALYGDQWRYCIMVICASNESLNERVGRGTTFINVVRDDWHNKLIWHLAKGDPWSPPAS